MYVLVFLATKVCVCVKACVCVCTCVWKLEVNLGSTNTLFVKIESLTGTWESLIQLDWLLSLSQTSLCLLLLSMGYKQLSPNPAFYTVLEIEIRSSHMDADVLSEEMLCVHHNVTIAKGP